ncbi:hypothetical protein Q0Z83_101640 [Actinoplanes sichuanensis]|uniref:PQQ-binding-like beta-propeller repeat protein n=1 Tax=Actinoplanes sichuanensis TaxID=512349 RepID=A0ABW4AJ67_9ACTN|nr:hypothetical protein [Actinoplanes sichuanensis]BEL11973.1 hypothetical protein Q0Z83_101640 [Actinoplanes sichuanensis]
MRDALIDLGEVPSGEPESALPRPPLPAYRWILGLLTVVLAALLGGAGPPPPSTDPVFLPINLGDRIQVAGDRLYVAGLVGPIGTVMRTYAIRAYQLPEVTPLGEFQATVPGDIFTFSAIGDDLLLVAFNDVQSSDSGLMAVRVGGGEPLWRRTASLYGLDQQSGLTLIQENVTSDRSVWRALDARTGAVHWSLEQPGSDQVTMSTGSYWAGYPARLFSVRDDGLIEVRDGRTGTLTATARLPRPPGPDFVAWATAGLLVAGYGTEETIAYDELTMAERWRRSGEVLPDAGFPQDCGPMICLAGFPSGLSVVDPATGREVAHSDGFDTAEVIGDRVLVAQASQTQPELAVLDPRTGRTAIAGPWASGGPGPKPGTAWIYRHQAVGYALRYGILDLATGRVWLRGRAERIAGDCRFSTDALVCRRLDSSIAIWRL